MGKTRLITSSEIGRGVDRPRDEGSRWDSERIRGKG